MCTCMHEGNTNRHCSVVSCRIPSSFHQTFTQTRTYTQILCIQFNHTHTHTSSLSSVQAFEDEAVLPSPDIERDFIAVVRKCPHCLPIILQQFQVLVTKLHNKMFLYILIIREQSQVEIKLWIGAL